METSAFPSCCGARILHDFFEENLTLQTLNIALTGIKGERASVVVAITSNREGERQKAAATTLKKRGFKKVFTTRNPNTSRQITLWALDLTRHRTTRPKIVRPSTE